MAFDKLTFEASFADALMRLAASEKVTKEDLKILSRTVLEAWHATGQVVYANKLLMVLSPVNKKVAVVFFKRLSGYSFDETQGMFTGKSKKRYEAAHAEFVEFFADPHNNIWTWADRHVEIQTKAFELDAVTKYFNGAFKKAQGVGLSQADVLRAVFKAGVEPGALVEAFNQMAFKDVEGSEVEIPAEMFTPAKAPVGDSPM